jgi:hypothetical protein
MTLIIAKQICVEANAILNAALTPQFSGQHVLFVWHHL